MEKVYNCTYFKSDDKHTISIRGILMLSRFRSTVFCSVKSTVCPSVCRTTTREPLHGFFTQFVTGDFLTKIFRPNLILVKSNSRGEQRTLYTQTYTHFHVHLQRNSPNIYHKKKVETLVSWPVQLSCKPHTHTHTHTHR